jgi:hypothetical protein
VRFALICVLIAGLANAQDSLQVVVTQGQNEIINIRQRVLTRPEVQVRDGNGAPVDGASVRFYLPATGAGGVFANGTDTMITATDHNGRAVGSGIQYRGTGKYEIRVIAQYQGQTATAFITQTNVAGLSTSGGGGSKRIWILLAIGAAAAGIGALVALRSGSGSAASNGPIVITPGTATVGGPH